MASAIAVMEEGKFSRISHSVSSALRLCARVVRGAVCAQLAPGQAKSSMVVKASDPRDRLKGWLARLESTRSVLDALNAAVKDVSNRLSRIESELQKLHGRSKPTRRGTL